MIQGDRNRMRKNDKLIVIIGVVILLISSIGIFLWVPDTTGAQSAEIEDVYGVCGTLCDVPNSITVSDDCPFYALIATPLAVHYDAEGKQEIIPLYVRNFDNPSRAIERVKYDQLKMLGHDECIIDGSESVKNVSLKIAQDHWESSDAALIVEDNESGYNLGVIATPLASYLGIPVIVTDKIDQDVMNVLSHLGVKYTIVCGENIEGFGNVLRFENVEEIVNASIDLLLKKFGDIDYVTLTNPIDAWPPEVLDREEYTLGPETLSSGATTQLVQTVLKGGDTFIGSFTIPKGYKYALIKFEGINLDADDVDEFGDAVSFSVGPDLPDIPPNLQKFEVFAGSTAAGGIPVRDAKGNIVTDRVYTEVVVYDRDGVEYNVAASGSWLVKKQGDVLANVVVEKLEDPVYPMMKGLSSLAPYLTAYHKGIVFGKPEFAFTANDDIITNGGETCPGFYMPRRNPNLTDRANEHIFDAIHGPLNELLTKIAGISLDKTKDIKNLREYYKMNPIYIALVGGATVLPQYIYQNHVEPVDVEETVYYVGGGTPSDVIYGNIDPIKYDWSNLANDIYSEYPYQENIVGRITGWDAQDASALIVRSIFYNDIIDQLGDWKDNFGLLMGGGCDFQKPLIRYLIFGDILGMVSRGEPMKYPTGCSELAGVRTVEQLAKPMGFTVYEAWEEEAMRVGLSDDAINRIKKDTTLLNKFFFHKLQVSRMAGEGNAKGGDIMESTNFMWANAHGNQHLFGMSGPSLTAAGLGGPLMHGLLNQILPIIGGFFGPGSSLSDVGDYTTRSVEGMNFGPSFMWLESCICGKIDGMYPEGSVGQALLHAGVTSLVASSTGSNIAGGYLEPKNRMYDTHFSVWKVYLTAKRDAKNGIYPDPHFGYRIYTDLCTDLMKNNVSIGLAFRNAKNSYLPSDADWELWWAPPLIYTGNYLIDSKINAERLKSTSSGGKGPMMEAKYVSFQEYLLFGDPAFNPYEPVNNG